jgi:hypothetical protein
MAFNLEIQDGPPGAWWLSPDIWTVPGADPTGTPGSPVEGQDCYLYARVSNTGPDDVTNAYVFYYILNPAIGFDRSTGARIGSASVSLRAGEAGDVLCLTPWQVQFVNEGHVCAVAEVWPESSPPSNPAFNVPADPRVAQRNLEILKSSSSNMLKESGFFYFPFEVYNRTQDSQTYMISARQGRTGELENLVPRYGGELRLPEEDGELSPLGLLETPSPVEEELDGAQPEVEIEMEPRSRRVYSLVGRIGEGGALAHVAQEVTNASGTRQSISGLSVFVQLD